MYAPALIVGDMIHVSGHVPWLEGGGFIQVSTFALNLSRYSLCLGFFPTFLRAPLPSIPQSTFSHIQGKVGLEVGPEVGVEAARRTGGV